MCTRSRAVLRYITPSEFWEQKLSFNTTNSLRQSLNPTDPMHPIDSFFERFSGQTQMVDWHESHLLGVAICILLLCGVDAFMTLRLLDRRTGRAMTLTGVVSPDVLSSAIDALATDH